MEKKTHIVETLNDLGNLITDENKDFLIADLVESLLFVVDIKEKVLKKTGEYPTDFLKSFEICFDGKIGVDKVSINGEIHELNKPQ